jgi:hypothetical protein
LHGRAEVRAATLGSLAFHAQPLEQPQTHATLMVRQCFPSQRPDLNINNCFRMVFTARVWL